MSPRGEPVGPTSGACLSVQRHSALSSFALAYHENNQPLLLDAGTVLFVRLYGNTTWVMCWSRTVVLLSRPRMRHSLLSFIRRAPTCVASRLVVQQSRRLLHRNAMLASLCYEKYAAFASRRGVCGTERVGSVWLDCGNPASIALCRRYARLVSRTAVGMGWARICISRGCELRLSTTHEGLGQA